MSEAQPRGLTDDERERLQPVLDDTEIPVRVTAEAMTLDDEALIAVAAKAVGWWPFERAIILREQCFDYSDEQLLGLLAHEIGHHRGHHGLWSRLATGGSVVVCLPVLLALAFGGVGGGLITGRWLVVLGSVLAMILLAGAIMLGSARISHWMEHDANRRAAALLDDPEPVAALYRDRANEGRADWWSEAIYPHPHPADQLDRLRE